LDCCPASGRAGAGNRQDPEFAEVAILESPLMGMLRVTTSW